jgi:hypothetical protein
MNLYFANLPEGKELLATLGAKPEHPIVNITKNSFIECVGKNQYRGVFFSKNPIEKLFQPILDKISFANDYKKITDYREAFSHYAGLEEKKYKYPQIFLAQDTFNSATGANSPVDGYAGRDGVNEIFGTIIAGAGNNSGAVGAAENFKIYASATTSQFANNYRYIGLFDTSTLTANANISSATLGFYVNGKTTGLGDVDLHVVASNPSANNALANSDYGTVESTTFGNVTYAGVTASAFNDITLNATGLAAISKTGISKFGTRNSWDLSGSFGGAWSSGADSGFNMDTSDGTNKPRLIIDYTFPEGGFYHMSV